MNSKLLLRCKNISEELPSNHSTFSEQPSQPRTDKHSELAPSLLRDSEGESHYNFYYLNKPTGTGLLSQPVPWLLLPPIPGTCIVYSVRLDGKGKVLALKPLLKGRAKSSPAVCPGYCYLVLVSPLTVSLDPSCPLRPSLSRVSRWFPLVVDGYVSSSEPSPTSKFLRNPTPPSTIHPDQNTHHQ